MTHGSEYVNPSIADSGQTSRGAQDRGLTKREYFAAMALQGMVAVFPGSGLKFEILGEMAVLQSDYLIEALNQLRNAPKERVME
jgi:hypothetical protein